MLTYWKEIGYIGRFGAVSVTPFGVWCGAPTDTRWQHRDMNTMTGIGYMLQHVIDVDIKCSTSIRGEGTLKVR